MDELSSITLMTEQDRHISEVIAEERSRLRNFIRKRVAKRRPTWKIFSEVFYELVEANRLCRVPAALPGERASHNTIRSSRRPRSPRPLLSSGGGVKDTVTRKKAPEGLRRHRVTYDSRDAFKREWKIGKTYLLSATDGLVPKSRRLLTAVRAALALGWFAAAAP
jgi:hypothetical protein